MKKLLILGLCIGVTCLLLAGTAQAATEAEKQQAIDDGLEWLAQTQQANGAWNYSGDNEDTAATGAALLAFLEKGYTAGTNVVINGTDYGDVIGDGYTWVLSRATVYTIGGEPTGNPDGDGNGVGLKFVPGGNNGRDTYVTSLVLPAIAKSGTPNKVVTTGPLAGRTDGTGPGGAWTYRDVVQNTVDWFAYGQADPGSWATGGWRYYADYGQADNSTAQWPPLAMLYASEMGVTAPNFVREQNRIWLDSSQNLGANAGYGGAYYDNRRDPVWADHQGGLGGSNEARTGGWLLQADFAGLGGPLSQSDVDAALAYLDTYWQTSANSTWDGNFAHPYAMWGIYKGLEVQIGLGDTTTITNLPALGTWRGAAASIDPGDAYNWWESYTEYLVATQLGTGTWNGYSNWFGALSTAWYINILQATEIPDPDPIPEPSTVVLLGLGLVGMALVSRRRRKS